ncbi:hypothetical protein FI667_g8939, partial [Globisporangium splendens]
MEGYLMKRGLKMPVMHDRYCVATWEVDQAQNKYVLLRSYKSHKNYLKHPTKPASAVTLKCFGDWDGYGNFHKYDHAFLFETRESKVFLCAAPSDAEKRKWIEFMTNAGPKQDEAPATAATIANNGNSIGRGSVELKQMMRPSLTLNKGLSSRFINEIASANPPEKKENNRLLARDDDTHSHSMTDSEYSPEDAHSPTSSSCASPHPGLDRGGVSDSDECIESSALSHDDSVSDDVASVEGGKAATVVVSASVDVAVAVTSDAPSEDASIETKQLSEVVAATKEPAEPQVEVVTNETEQVVEMVTAATETVEPQAQIETVAKDIMAEAVHHESPVAEVQLARDQPEETEVSTEKAELPSEEKLGDASVVSENKAETVVTATVEAAPVSTPVADAAVVQEKPKPVLKEKVFAVMNHLEVDAAAAKSPSSESRFPVFFAETHETPVTKASEMSEAPKTPEVKASPEPLISIGVVPVAAPAKDTPASPPRGRVRAYSSIVPNSGDSFETRRYSFSGGSPAPLSFTFSSPIKPSLHNHTLGYVHGLAPTRLSFPDIVTALTRQQSVESQSSDDANLQEDLAFAFEFAPFSVSVPEVADIDEV